MRADDLDQLLRLMLENGFSHVSYSEGGFKISMTIPAGQSPGIAPMPDAPRSEAALVTSRAIGMLLTAHPARSGDAPKPGDHVIAGQPVAYVRNGDSLSAVTAEVTGVLGRQLCESGRIVGHGTPVFELFPDASMRPNKG
jgi:hypothetical protein